MICLKFRVAEIEPDKSARPTGKRRPVAVDAGVGGVDLNQGMVVSRTNHPPPGPTGPECSFACSSKRKRRFGLAAHLRFPKLRARPRSAEGAEHDESETFRRKSFRPRQERSTIRRARRHIHSEGIFGPLGTTAAADRHLAQMGLE
ncbi:hypothetical protein [Cognatazoarcus halotolerans]|uniref:hypothetical protein n=1 Tax=Cognatazoarcus halotolerans TaxID=2686016 RepID=UPI00135B1160|nr:hypothetical protein [Cognatazoarcus halotolerans]MCB1901499.1 hypothetical protein [Rhodocyclaceae bacterium]MCP5308136.1 hypothetical protein [Zoogloeaceae bacterium]